MNRESHGFKPWEDVNTSIAGRRSTRLARYRMMSSEASSAQWASSTTTTAGRREKLISSSSASMKASRSSPRTPEGAAGIAGHVAERPERPRRQQVLAAAEEQPGRLGDPGGEREQQRGLADPRLARDQDRGPSALSRKLQGPVELAQLSVPFQQLHWQSGAAPAGRRPVPCTPFDPCSAADAGQIRLIWPLIRHTALERQSAVTLAALRSW